MPAEAGIQAVGDNNNFKDLDSRFRGNDVTFPIATQPLMGEGEGGGDLWDYFTGSAEWEDFSNELPMGRLRS
jgi:hypothetical protein